MAHRVINVTPGPVKQESNAPKQTLKLISKHITANKPFISLYHAKIRKNKQVDMCIFRYQTKDWRRRYEILREVDEDIPTVNSYYFRETAAYKNLRNYLLE